MIVEIRRYTIVPGRREEFIQFFETKNRQALRDAGILVFGPMRDLENTDRVHWMRAFHSLEERNRLKEAFYQGPVWNQKIEPFVMPMILHYESVLTETTLGFENFDGLTYSRKDPQK